MNQSRATFSKFVEELGKIHNPSVARLAPPALDSKIAQLETFLGISIPDEIRDVYKLHNGHNDHFSTGTIFNRMLLTIDQVMEEINIHGDIRRSGIVDDTWIEDPRVTENFPSTGHIPLLSDGTGNFIGYDLRPSKQGCIGQVLVFGADVDVRVIFDSIEQLWGTLLEELHTRNWIIQLDEITKLTELHIKVLHSKVLQLLWA